MDKAESSALAHSLPADHIAEAIAGAAFIEGVSGGIAPCQLPQWARMRAGSEHFDVLARATTGVTVAVRTSASVIELHVQFTRYAFLGSVDPIVVSVTADGRRTDVEVADDEGTIISEDAAKQGSTSRLRFAIGASDEERDVVIHLPQGAATTMVDVSADRPVVPAQKRNRPVWLHHGSSISHGSSMPHPESPWPVRVAHAVDVQVLNASFSGNCLLDPFVADALSTRDVDVLSVEVGINIVNWDSHIERTFVPALHGFLDRFRWARPNLPILLITPFYCGFHEDHGGPIDLGEDGLFRASESARPEALTLSDVRRLVNAVLEVRNDPNLFIVDGRNFLGEGDAALLYDGLHPDEAGTQTIAERFVRSIRERGDVVGRAFLSP